MGSYTDITRRWLERRFRYMRRGVYIPHQPIYGLNNPNQQEIHVPILARTFQILRLLNRIEFVTLLDVGAGEGLLPHLGRDLFGARAMASDISLEACRRAREIFGLESIALNAPWLPFADATFDVVVCSEVVEHVEQPVEVLLEVARVARKAIVVTTDEIYFDPEERDRELFERGGLPHVETCMFLPEDFETLYGPCDERWLHFRGAPPAEPIAVADAIRWIETAVREPVLAPDGEGIALLKVLDPAARRAARFAERDLLERLLATKVAETAVGGGPHAGDETVWPGTLQVAVCPRTRQPLALRGERLVAAGYAYPVVGGVPDLFVGEERPAAGEDAGGGVRRREVAELRAKLALPDWAGRRAWDFSAREDRRGWKANSELAPRPGPGHGFHWRSQGEDPWVVGPRIDLDPGDLGLVEIRMRIHHPGFARDGGLGQLYWLAEDAFGFSEDATLRFPVINDGAVHTYRLRPQQSERWPRDGLVLAFRLDPANGPCEIDLCSFRLVPAG